jgi:hypothetical protein
MYTRRGMQKLTVGAVAQPMGREIMALLPT